MIKTAIVIDKGNVTTVNFDSTVGFTDRSRFSKDHLYYASHNANEVGLIEKEVSAAIRYAIAMGHLLAERIYIS